MNILIQGMRPKTLVAAIIPPLSASGIYYLTFKQHNTFVLLLCLALALFIQIATNFYNDAVDFKKGADEDRIGPERVTTDQNLNKIFMLGHLFIVMAFLVGIPLVMQGGVPILLLGLISLFFAYGYTGGPFPLAYLGLGELFVFIFFGLVATLGTFFLLSGELTLNAWLIAVINGLLSSVLIAINNLRDKEKDVLVNKNTLAVKLSENTYLKMLDGFIFIPYIIVLYFAIFVNLKFFIVILALKFAHLTRYVIHNYHDPKELNKALEFSGKHMLVFGILFWIICLWT